MKNIMILGGSSGIGNCIAPSITLTPLTEFLLSSKEKINLNNERHPLKRFGQVEDIADVAAFLSDEKSSWITGQIIHVDGAIESLER